MISRRDRKKADRLIRRMSQRPESNQSSHKDTPVVTEERGSNDSSIIRHGAGQLETFELRESELEKIENNIWGGRFFDFGINCVTIAVTLLVTIITCDDMKTDIRAYFNFALVLCILGAVVFFYKSYELHQERKDLFQKIRNRA